ncbi:hypothetical protein QR680_010560 [Steinernema hermaphroditum]|uniref:UPAR/Ly6 domain-containing protein n=1 Tax=Steinernema hermaphroditum TaxID=289476 RepID=A0AA39IS35_9BILA|nr:hypothetical protein QR680_010560 [Steinernema hermaphroditum]
MKISPTLLGLCVAVSIVTSARSEFQCYNVTVAVTADSAAKQGNITECPVKKCGAVRFKVEGTEADLVSYSCEDKSTADELTADCGNGENIFLKASLKDKKKLPKGASMLEAYCCNTSLCNESLEKTKKNLAPSSSAPSSTTSSSSTASSTLTPIFIGLLIFFGFTVLPIRDSMCGVILIISPGLFVHVQSK